MTMPSKIWMRSLSPSRTFTWTRTVSPDLIDGRSVICDFSTSSIALMTSAPLRFFLPDLLEHSAVLGVEIRRIQQVRPPLQRPLQRCTPAPPVHVGVITRQQHLG